MTIRLSREFEVLVTEFNKVDEFFCAVSTDGHMLFVFDTNASVTPVAIWFENKALHMGADEGQAGLMGRLKSIVSAMPESRESSGFHVSVEYKVGEADPTNPDGNRVVACAAIAPGPVILRCSWPTPHNGKPHVAGDGATILAVWNQD